MKRKFCQKNCKFMKHNENYATVSRLKPATLYSSLFAKQRQNHFFAKKFEFCETLRKRIYRLFVIDSSFRKQHANLFGATNNAFVFWPKSTPSSEDTTEHRTKNLFAKRQQKCSTYYSYFVAYHFIHFLLLFANSV